MMSDRILPIAHDLNWQQPDWPNFRWEHVHLRKAEEHCLMGAGVLAGILKHLSQSDREQVTIDAMSTEAVAASEIEGEILDRASEQSSIRRQLGFTAEEELSYTVGIVPLSMTISVPVIAEARYDAAKATSSATSSGLLGPPSGMPPSISISFCRAAV